MKDIMMISDMPLAVVLSSLGFQLQSLDRTDPARFQFCFKEELGLEDAISAFWRGELRLEPKALFLNHKLLKSRIFSAL